MFEKGSEASHHDDSDRMTSGEIIEALHPETRCWLTAHFIQQISDTAFEIEWYDDELKKSFPTPTIIVSEIRKEPEGGTRRYFCTACGEKHDVDDSIVPATANTIRDEHPNAPKWLSKYSPVADELEGICENCYDALRMFGDPNFPDYDLLE